MLYFLVFLISSFFVPLHAQSVDASQERHAWTLNESYTGPYKAAFDKLKWEIPILMRQTVVDISGKLGLWYEEGWRYPLTVKFVDGSPRGVENALAFVGLSVDREGIRQNLNINLEAYERDKFNFEKVLAHELTHAFLNDQLGAEAALLLPVWLQEGLAVYASGQGDQMLKYYASQFLRRPEERILNGLEGPHGPLDYAEDFLAIRYIYETHGNNSLHNFVREVVKRKGDVPGAIEYACLENWASFQENARRFSAKEIQSVSRSLRGSQGGPY